MGRGGRLALGLGALAGVFALGAGLLVTGRVRFNYPSRASYPVWGLDVSRHQRQIAWPAVERQDYDFVFIKATEGGDWRDPLFAANWAGAERAGLARGAYHFFRTCTDAHLQARNFIAAVPRDGELPPVIGVEPASVCAEPASRDSVRARVATIVREVERAFGQAPLIYTTHPGTYDAYIAGNVDRYPLWMSDKWREPRGPGVGRWVFWQFTALGRVDGIDTPVDVNVFRGTRAQFDRLVRAPAGVAARRASFGVGA